MRALHSCVLPILPTLALLAAAARGQTMTFASPAAPGSQVAVRVVNSTPHTVGIDGRELRLHAADGEVVHPVFVGCGAVGDLAGPNAVMNYTLYLPSSGVATQGSFLLRAALPIIGASDVAVAVGRLDIGTAAASFPSLHFYPAGVHENGASHWVLPGAAVHYEIANTDTVPHTLGASDVLSLHVPGAAVPFANVPLQGLVVPAGRALRLALPVANLPLANVVVRSHWQDPALGATTTSAGLYVAAQPTLDLQLPEGHAVPPQGALPVVIAGGIRTPSPRPARLYALAFGITPGVMPLPGGGELPLVYDFVVAASLANGLLGVIDHPIGVTADEPVYCAHRQTFAPVVRDLHIVHPNVAAIAGLVLRCAAVTIEPATLQIQASPAAEILFR